MTMLHTTIGNGSLKDLEEEDQFSSNNYWATLRLPLTLELWSYYSAKGIGIAVPRRPTDLFDTGDDDGETYFDPFHSRADYLLVRDWFNERESIRTGVEGDNYFGARVFRIGTDIEPILAYTQFGDRLTRGDATRISLIKVTAYFGGIAEHTGFSEVSEFTRRRHKDLEYDRPQGYYFRVGNCEV